MKKRPLTASILIAMKLTIVQMALSVAFAGTLYAGRLEGQDILERPVSMSVKNERISRIISLLTKQTGVKFLFSPEGIRTDRKLDCNVSDVKLRDFIDATLRPMNIGYKVLENKILLYSYPSGTPVLAPIEKIVYGTVRNEKGEPIGGASVTIKGSATGVSTDTKGEFSIPVPGDAVILLVSYVGYQSQEVMTNGQSRVQVTLQPVNRSMDEVVVIGYGQQRKGDLTGALSTVSSKEFENQPVTRLDQALQGRTTGVQVTNSSGSPGGDVRIRIRGANSLTGDNSPLYVVDGFVGADFNNINAEDIATIVVLKDASSTAIYGSRGANGVIIITTKSGRKGLMQIDAMTRLSSSEIISKFDIMNAADFARTVNARRQALTPAGGTYTPRFTDAEIQQFEKTGGTDWQDVIFRRAFGQEYQLGFSGGNDKTSYRINGNYLQQDGVIKNTDFKRYSIRSNINSQISDKFSLRWNFAATRRENHNTSGTGSRNGALGQALAWAPTTPVYDTAGNYTIKDPTSSIFYNPLATAMETDNRDERTNLNSIGGLRYKITPELTLDVQAGVDYTNIQSKAFAGPDITANVPSAARGSAENILLQNTNNLTYKKTFHEVHNLEITGVFETQKFTATGFNVGVNGLIYPDQSYNNIALSSSSQVSSGANGWSLLSLLGRVNYAYKNKYLVSGSIRRDGSSKFRGSNKYSTFPSAAVAWKISEEPFMQDQRIFSDLKLRGSWGLTGNQGINPYGTLSTYTTNLDDAGAIFNGASGTIVSGIALGNLGNPNLKWETTEQTNVGLDVQLIKGVVTFSADYFNKKTRNLLLSEPLPGYLGGSAILSNVGNMQNRGWEFSLGLNLFSRRDINWTSTVSLSYVKNKLLSLGKGRTNIIMNPFILQPGQPIGSFYGNKFLGTYKAHDAAEAAIYGLKPGDARYLDVNHDSVINAKDYQIIGNAIPTTSIGWNNTVTYKAFTLNIFIQGMFGFDKLNYSYAFGMLGSTDAKEVLFSDIKKRYIPGVNENSNIPAFSSASTNALNQTSRFIEKADFLRLKNLSLSYQLKKSALRNLGALSFFVSATNLLTWTHYKGIDPESNSNQAEGITGNGFVADTQQGLDQGAYPNTKTYTVGLKLAF